MLTTLMKAQKLEHELTQNRRFMQIHTWQKHI